MKNKNFQISEIDTIWPQIHGRITTINQQRVYISINKDLGCQLRHQFGQDNYNCN
jgi:hypothetical protein